MHHNGGPMNRYAIIVDGRVQGVGFRYRVVVLATDHHLTGWVRNLNNGMVELEVQGEETDLAAFLSGLRKNDRFIRIDDYSVKSIQPHSGETGFHVRY
jgi:acylphosphatase